MGGSGGEGFEKKHGKKKENLNFSLRQQKQSNPPNVGGVDEEFEGVLRGPSSRGEAGLLLPFQLPHSLLAVRGEPKLSFSIVLDGNRAISTIREETEAKRATIRVETEAKRAVDNEQEQRYIYVHATTKHNNKTSNKQVGEITVCMQRRKTEMKGEGHESRNQDTKTGTGEIV